MLMSAAAKGEPDCRATQVGQLLLMDPNNEELQEMYKGLLEVRALGQGSWDLRVGNISPIA